MRKIHGLTSEQVQLSKKQFGTNRLTQQKREGFWAKYLSNFGDPIIKVLMVALLINVIFTLTGSSEWYETVGIFLAIVLATFVSTFSEYNNEETFQKLQQEASQINCKVYRDGIAIEIPQDEIVVGDQIILQAGDKIPADGIIIEGTIHVDQSALNGEAKEALKRSVGNIGYKPNGDLLNEFQVFRGSVVCSGEGVMEASAVGDTSMYGKITQEVQVEVRDSPLKVKLAQLAHKISIFGYVGGVAIAAAFILKRAVFENGFNLLLMQEYFSNWMNVLNDLIQAVILAVIVIVMAVPEGLPLMIAIVSSLNMKKMLKDKVLVRKIAGIETAGSLNILFSDKTGTITQGKLEVVSFVNGENIEYSTYSEINNKLRDILRLSITANSGAIYDESTDKVIGGNATDRALLGFIGYSQKPANFVKVHSIPFNSLNKYSAVEVKGDENITLIKGAPEKLLRKCRYYYDSSGNKKPFRNFLSIERHIEKMASRAIRVLAIVTSETSLINDTLPNETILVGVVGIRDDVRPEAVKAIREVKNAGLQVVMITGDRKDTASVIAKEAGLISSDDDLILTSDDLRYLSDEEVKSILPSVRVIARALPSDKSRLVRIAQSMELVVGMTGDGVNDAPALKQADVGFAMGSGTEVAKEAGDIVILDDNFLSIEKSVLYGRTIYNSIRKFIVFQLSINLSAVLISFLGPLMGVDRPLTITQILWVNLVMDTLAAIAFGGEPALRKYMKEQPKSRNESIISSKMWSQILVDGFYIGLFGITFLSTSIFRGFFRDEELYFLTAFFTLFIFMCAFNGFNARTDSVNLFEYILGNKGFLHITTLIFVVQIIMTYFGGYMLRTGGLLLAEFEIVLLLSMTVIPLDIFRKIILT